MKMTGILASAVALVLLGTGTANALIATPSTPPTNSALLVTVFDVTNNESVTIDLGLFYNTFIDNTVGPGTILTGAYTEQSFALDMSQFSDNNVANLRYNVYAGDATGIVNNGLRGVLITSSSPAPTMTVSQLNAINTAGNGIIVAINTFAAGATPYTADYGDETKWGDSLANNFTASGSSAALGSPVNFFAFASNANGLDTPATLTAFGNGFEWNLTQSGTLTWGAPVAPIPLPAAAWLLLSGIAGLGAFSRRRSAQA